MTYGGTNYMRRKFLWAMLMITVICVVIGCGKKKEGVKEVTEEKNPDEILYEKLFDINNVVKVDIDISDEELLKIQKDYEKYGGSKSPIYRRADKVTITINDEDYVIEDVGVRMKGNTSRESFFNSSNIMYNLINFRLSFDETFDNPEYYGTEARVWEDENAKKEREKRKFATLSGLELKWNKNLDTTYVREIYANDMFRDFGLMSQHEGLAATRIGKTNVGVYMIYEPVDKQFLKKYFNKDEIGDLYKASWTNRPAGYTKDASYGTDTNSGSRYNYTLKTNKKTSKHELYSKFIEQINDNNLTKDAFSSVVDTDYFVKFSAVSYFVGNPDDMRNNFNNHYLYLTKENKAYFIPYDNDRVFGITVDWNPDGTGMTAVSPFSDVAAGFKSWQFNPLIRNTIINKDGLLYEEYVKALDEVAKSKWLTNEHFETYFETAKKNYESFVAPDKDFDNASKGAFKFTLDGVYNGGNDINMSMSEYLERKLKTYREALNN